MKTIVVTVVFAWLQAAARGQIAPALTGTSFGDGVQANVSTYTNSRPYFGLAVWNIPASATNKEAFLSFDTTAPLRTRQELFAAPPTEQRLDSILWGPREFIGALETNSASSHFEIDVTPWTQRYAGRKLGVIFAITADEPGAKRTDFANLLITLNSPDARDAEPHIEWAPAPARVVKTNSFPLSAEVYDVDSEITQVLLKEGTNTLASLSEAGPLTTGNFTLSNVSPGIHRYTIWAGSVNKLVPSEERLVYVGSAEDEPKHRWLGFGGSSESFYVIDSAGRAHVWGRNDYGQLGLGFRSAQGEYGIKRPVTLIGPDGRRFRQIADSRSHAIALMDDNSIYTWGSNFSGETGHGGADYILTPTRLSLPSGIFLPREVGAVNGRSYILDQSGGVWIIAGAVSQLTGAYRDLDATGNGILLQKSDGSLTGISFPPGVDSWATFCSGAPFKSAIGNNHQLYCWRDTDTDVTLVQVEGVTDWTRLANAVAENLAIDDQNRVFAWTETFANGLTTPMLLTFPRPVSGWLDMIAAAKHNLALSVDGDLYAWGSAEQGVWNDPSAIAVASPEKVLGLPNLLNPLATEVRAVFVGFTNSAAGMSVRLTGPIGVSLPIEASSDLQSWSFLTELPNPNGQVVWSLPLESGEKKFFRIGSGSP